MFKRRITRRCRVVILSCLIFAFCLVTLLFRKPYIVRDMGYLTRPIWDFRNRPNPSNYPEIIIPHYQADGLSTKKLCSLHGWELRTEPNSKPKVIDAFIFSIELDILEVRLKELWDVVDIFLVMEADLTFTGIEKPLVLNGSIERFAWAKEKLHHTALEHILIPNPSLPMDNEVVMRRHMTEKIVSIGARKGDLIIVGDVDEIPFKETIQLLKSCEGYPSDLHLQMRNYLYSFEFYMTTSKNWKPHVAIFSSKDFRYYHGKRTTSHHQLADAGWHCSFCFRYLSDFVFKMKGFSHSDRVTSPDFFKTERIQRKICDGADIFDMYPEAYSFKELLATMGNIPRSESTIGIPNYVVENSEKFKFLLPGGCMREYQNVSTDLTS